MKLRLTFQILSLLITSTLTVHTARAQFLVDMIDTTSTEEKGLWAIYRKTDHLQISGYFQPQFQWAQSKGAENYSGGDFARHANNRFMMRRARIRFDYAHFNDNGLPRAQVVFQFDGSERGVVIRDFWGRLYENKWQLFSVTTGMFARPFGFEINYSSGDREAPERGRMSQILMRTERDLGIMGSFEPRKRNNPFRLLKFDVGVFNGQGLTGSEDYDSYKDVISRLSLKPYPLSRKVSVSGGASFFEGGIVQNSRYIYNMVDENGGKIFKVDSSERNIGRKLPRKYRGLDAQLRVKHKWGKSELRTEYWWGTQTGSVTESATPGSVLTQPYYVRDFHGAFVYFLQNVVNDRHQLVVKYDFYDPNRRVSGASLGNAVNNTNHGDIKYNTVGLGYLYYLDSHIKLIFWYDMIRNEHTSLNGFTRDVRDNIFTCRLQYKF